MSTALKKVETKEIVATPQNESATMFSMVQRMATDPNISPERVNQAFDFYQRVQADQAAKQWSSAFVAAQKEMEPIKKDASNSQTHSRYASFEALDGALRPIYSQHGFGVSFDTEDSPKPDHVRVVMYLIHDGGHQRRYHQDIPADGKGAKGNDVMTKTHAAGSANTYGRRYVLGNAFNVATTDRDDDGNAAGANDTLITSDQVTELIDLADEIGADKAKFCKFYGIESFADIRACKFEAAKAALEAKRGKK